ncbi:MAG: M20/M25/M40 family metallo-hydrolase [Janthinobacterium lividum]
MSRSHSPCRLSPSLLLCMLAAIPAFAQDVPAGIVPLSDPRIAKAVSVIQSNEAHFIEEQIRLCEIPSPPFHEDVRAAEIKRLFTAAGLKNVRIDAAGNVLGDRPGKVAHPQVVLAAHLDTVFPEGTDVHVTRTGNLLKGPGIGDDCRGLAALLAVIRAMDEAKIETRGSLTFVADVGEEGLGDLRGMKQLFNATMKGQIDEFLSIEPGLPTSITDKGVGSYRYKVTFTGPGGHSYGAFGNANPIHAMGRTISKISDMQPPASPKTTFNVGRIGGGTSINSIPFEAWFEFDERSESMAALDTEDAIFKTAVQAGLDEENTRWHDKGKLAVKVDRTGVRPAGETAENKALVQTAIQSIAALGFGKATFGDGSSDSNVPMNLGIPAITIGGGGKDSGAHSLGETDDITDSWKGPANALLIVTSRLQ